MSLSIRVTPEQLDGLSGRLSGGSASIDGQLAELSAAVLPLLGADWAGQASEQFRMLWDEWQESGRRLREALDGMSVLMGRAASAYAQVEDQVAASFRL
jgi:WXG100 family type VII secretion target